MGPYGSIKNKALCKAWSEREVFWRWKPRSWHEAISVSVEDARRKLLLFFQAAKANLYDTVLAAKSWLESNFCPRPSVTTHDVYIFPKVSHQHLSFWKLSEHESNMSSWQTCGMHQTDVLSSRYKFTNEITLCWMIVLLKWTQLKLLSSW